MWFCSGKRWTCAAASILVLILLLALAPESQAVERLRVRVADTTGSAGQNNSVVTVYLNNTFDDVAAFTLHLILSRNDIANFQNTLDTVIDTTYWKEWCWHCTHWNGTLCTDSAQSRDTCAVDYPTSVPKNWDFIRVDTVEAYSGNFDTVGTLISGWEQVESRAVSTGDLGLDIKITAIADKSQPAAHHPPLHPQQGGVLIKLLADIFPIPDSQLDREAGIVVDVAWKPYFVFSTPVGEAIGWTSVPVPDTNYYMCTSPEPPPGTGCYVWTKVHQWECPGGECDSIFIDTIDVARLDTTQVRVMNGKITVSSWKCGDCNANGSLSISDISLLVDHLFINKTPIIPVERCNTNCTTEIPVKLTIGDVATLVDRLFISGRKMCCEH